jgi:HK97 family phage portal protein
MPWSGWPADWTTPGWNSGRWGDLVDTAWVCLDLNANLLASMPPYLVDAAPSTPADWLNNPAPDLYSSWEEFAKQLFWDYQLGEAFVIATAYYSTGWPARFHVVPGYMVSVEWDYETGTRRYSIGGLDVTEDILHIRYRSVTGNAHGMGPLDAMQSRIIAAGVLMRYATNLATSGGIPSSILTHPEELNAAQAAALQAQWVNARMSHLGEPAVISGGATWQSVAINPKDMALHDLATFNEARIAVALGVPPFLVGLPSGADSMTYKNLINIYDYHWRAGLRPKAQMVMSALSGWLVPRGTRVEINRDAYVEPDPLERAQTAQILHGIQDPNGETALTVAEIRASERLTNSTPNDVSAGVLR